MALADPQTIASLSGVTSLPRTGAPAGAGNFSSADGTIVLSVATSNGKRNRTVVRLTQSKITTDPLIPSQNIRPVMSAQLVIDRPLNGFSNAEIKAVADTLSAWLAASTGANVTKILGGEV